MTAETAVIVGSSVAGVRTAKALRNENFGGRIILVGKEKDLPYDKPPLSKQYLAGSWDDDRITLLTAEEAAAANIELRLGVAAVGLDTACRTVRLADGSVVGYNSLVIATGADARPAPWTVDSGLHVVRTLDDSRRLADALAVPGHVVVVGGGFIGAEVASTAWSSGHDVTIVDPSEAPMGRLVGVELGTMLADVHRRHGVETRFGQSVEAVSGSAGALRVTLSGGEALDAAAVIVGIGARPNDGWLADSALLIDNGVVCDEFCRAVGHPDITAVGDVARWYHQGHQERVRVEHWTNASEQAACVAHNLAQPDDLRVYTPTEYVWSDQYGWKIQIAGRPNRGALHRLIGDLEGDNPRAAAVFADERDVLCGVVTVNWPKAVMICRQLVASGAHVAEAVGTVALLPRPMQPAQTPP